MKCLEFRKEMEEKNEIITEIGVSIRRRFMLAVFWGSKEVLLVHGQTHFNLGFCVLPS